MRTIFVILAVLALAASLPAITKTWTGGDILTDWGRAANWSPSGAPTSADDVTIPGGLASYPTTSLNAGVCNNLTIQNGGRVTVAGQHLTVYGTMYSEGNLSMSSPNGQLTVYQGMTFGIGSYVSISNPTATIKSRSHMTFQAGSSVFFSMGFIDFTGSTWSYLENHSANTKLNNVTVDKTSGAALAFSNASTQDLVILGNLVVNDGSNTYNYSNLNIRLHGDLWDHNTGPTTGVRWNSGTLVMQGGDQDIQLPGVNAFINNLTVYTANTFTLTLLTNLTLKGTLRLERGELDANQKFITVGGDWRNTVGPAAFLHSGARVTFNGEGDQFCVFPENFATLWVDKPAGMLKINANASCEAYAWVSGGIEVINDATFTVSSLLTTGIRGNWSVAYGSTIDLYNPGASINLNGNLTINGTFNVYGGNNDSSWANAANTTVTIASEGILDFKDRGIAIPGSSYSLNVTMGVNSSVRTVGSLNLARNGFNFNGGIVRFYGNDNAFVLASSTSTLPTLQVQKGTGTLACFSDLTLIGHCQLLSGTFQSFTYLYVAGNWNNSVGAAAFIPGGTVTFNGSGNHTVSGTTSFGMLQLNKDGRLSLLSGSNVTCGNYRWMAGTLSVTGGSFTALDLYGMGIEGNLEISAGTVHLHQSPNTYLDLKGNLNVSGGELHLHGGYAESWFPWGNDTSLILSDGLIQFHDHDVMISNIPLNFNAYITGGTIKIPGSLTILRQDFTPYGGWIEFYGSADASISIAQNSNFHALNINKTASRDEDTDRSWVRTNRDGERIETLRARTVSCATNVSVAGNFNILSGFFIAPPNLRVAGNWNNYVGADAFVEGDGTVTFYGSAVTGCTSETFNILELYKHPSTGYLRILAGNEVTCASYLWNSGWLQVSGGSFTALDFPGQELNGNYLLTDGTMNLHQDTDSTFYLNGRLTVSGGVLNVSGGIPNLFMYWPTASGNSVIQTGGEIHVHHGLWFESVDDTTVNLSGGTLYVKRDLWVGRPNVASGTHTTRLDEDVDQYLDMLSGCSLRNVQINKSHPYKVIIANYNDNLITGALTIVGGGLKIHLQTYLKVEGLFNVYNAFVEMSHPEAVIECNSILWHAGSTAAFTAGTLLVHAALRFTSDANINLPPSVHVKLENSSTYVLVSPWIAGTMDLRLGALIIGSPSVPTEVRLDPNQSSNLSVLLSGELTINAGSKLTTYESDLEVDGDLYLDGWLDMNGENTITVHGRPHFPTSSKLSITNNGTFHCDQEVGSTALQYHGTLIMNSGTLHLEVYTPHFMETAQTEISGGTIICEFIRAIYANTFQPSGGTVILRWLLDIGQSSSVDFHDSNWMHHLIMDHLWWQVTYMSSNLTVNGNITLQSGVLDVFGHTLHCHGHIDVNNSAILRLGVPGSQLHMDDAKYVSINMGGKWISTGSYDQSVLVTSSTGYYDFYVQNGGLIEATHTTFEKMGIQGLYLKAGSQVQGDNKFLNCRFRYGHPSGTLLTIDNVQNLGLMNVDFPSNTWGSANNVYKMNNAGCVNFANATGLFAGEAHELDPYGKVFWSQPSYVSDLKILDAQWDVPTGELGETRNLLVTVLNDGLQTAEGIVVRAYYNLPQSPVSGQPGDQQTQRSLPPSVPYSLVFEVTNNDPGSLGLWNSWIRINPDNSFSEGNYTNNNYGPVAITWTGVTGLNPVTITQFYLDASQNPVLVWEHDNPPGVSFNIYRSTDPYFTPGPAYLLHNTPLTQYTDTNQGDRYFYRVSAVIND
ncbi:MAG: hypothetical protein KBA54_00175 [Candidatus Cloacimonetes bacterium]|nr:hypothetical protein [Candidatus Cloacimonadota bacterium]